MVPCLIVQPIVENVVFHGAMCKKTGIVEIKVSERDSDVLISVSDNGNGIPDHVIERLRNNTTDDKNIGLSNVYKRLFYIYGKENGLDIVSTPSGTTVNISIIKNKLITIVG